MSSRDPYSPEIQLATIIDGFVHSEAELIKEHANDFARYLMYEPSGEISTSAIQKKKNELLSHQLITQFGYQHGMEIYIKIIDRFIVLKGFADGDSDEEDVMNYEDFKPVNKKKKKNSYAIYDQF